MHYMTFHDVITTQFGFGENVKKSVEWLSNVLITREYAVFVFRISLYSPMRRKFFAQKSVLLSTQRYQTII